MTRVLFHFPPFLAWIKGGCLESNTANSCKRTGCFAVASPTMAFAPFRRLYSCAIPHRKDVSDRPVCKFPSFLSYFSCPKSTPFQYRFRFRPKYRPNLIRSSSRTTASLRSHPSGRLLRVCRCQLDRRSGPNGGEPTIFERCWHPNPAGPINMTSAMTLQVDGTLKAKSGNNTAAGISGWPQIPPLPSYGNSRDGRHVLTI